MTLLSGQTRDVSSDALVPPLWIGQGRAFMANEFDEEPRKQLRVMRGDIEELKEGLRATRVVQDQQSLHLDFLDERIEQLKEATLTSVRIAIELGAREKRIEEQFAQLTTRVEKLERAK